MQTRELKSHLSQASERDRDADAFGKFRQNKMSIQENELKRKVETTNKLLSLYYSFLSDLETSLDQLEGKTRSKRQTDDDFNYVSEEPSGVTNEQDQNQETDDEAKFEVQNTLQGVQLPPKTGSSTFSIHAEKVYILYPSTFQDPNIFGRFSIPQTINLDPLAAKMVTQNDELQAGQSNSSPSQSQLNDSLNSSAYLRGKRQIPSPKRDEKKRNVETHLNGSIVVMNQDVNEFNRKESY